MTSVIFLLWLCQVPGCHCHVVPHVWLEGLLVLASFEQMPEARLHGWHSAVHAAGIAGRAIAGAAVSSSGESMRTQAVSVRSSYLEVQLAVK